MFQVDEWLNKLFDGFRLNITKLAEADSVNLHYQEKGENHMSAYRRAVNVGFGITYVLPVLVALLKAKKGIWLLLKIQRLIYILRRRELWEKLYCVQLL